MSSRFGLSVMQHRPVALRRGSETLSHHGLCAVAASGDSLRAAELPPSSGPSGGLSHSGGGRRRVKARSLEEQVDEER
ncbi:hypothetical protein AAFF_G00132820 [Aldrovandia affinis]|uniref:Uncharacterized protein n=1 Tax=Aldrovandia affinis TaxID=143900 RepID=A0AAD7RQI5_9TELE|nr:hypothetical protein AAFF_G00132820 [Aldrovandia affinis]